MKFVGDSCYEKKGMTVKEWVRRVFRNRTEEEKEDIMQDLKKGEKMCRDEDLNNCFALCVVEDLYVFYCRSCGLLSTLTPSQMKKHKCKC